MAKKNKKVMVLITALIMAILFSIIRNIIHGYTIKTLITFASFTSVLLSLSLIPYLKQKKLNKNSYLYLILISSITSLATPLFWLFVNYNWNIIDILFMLPGRIIINLSAFYLSLMIHKQV